MKQAPGYLLDEQSVRKLADAVRRLEGELRIVRQQLADSQRPSQWPRELTWGVTSKRDDASYPDSAAVAPGGYNVYWVELADVYFEQPLAANVAAGLDSTITIASQASNYVQACSLTNVPIPEGTRVIVERHWSTQGWRYWIRPNWTTMYRATAAEEIAAAANGEVDILGAGDVVLMTVTAYYTWMDVGTINLGDELLVAWFEADDRWYIIGRNCGA